MKTHLDSEFNVDLQEKTIEIQRSFNAALPRVWRAWTDHVLLDQWWGPACCRAETKSMDFREGGRWHYAMILPDGQTHWSKADYITIEKEKFFSARDGFCDEHAVLNPSLPENLWETRFLDQDKHTHVKVRLLFGSEEDLKTTLSMGFKEGFSVGLDQLSELLESMDHV